MFWKDGSFDYVHFYTILPFLKQEDTLREWSWLWLYVSVYLAPDRPLQMNGSKLCSVLTLQSCSDRTLGSVFGGWVCRGSLPLSVSLFWFCWAYVAVNTDIFQQGASRARSTCVLCPWTERGRLWWNTHNHVNSLFQTLSVCQKLCIFLHLILWRWRGMWGSGYVWGFL